MNLRATSVCLIGARIQLICITDLVVGERVEKQKDGRRNGSIMDVQSDGEMEQASQNSCSLLCPLMTEGNMKS